MREGESASTGDEGAIEEDRKKRKREIKRQGKEGKRKRKMRERES